jgi:hypothetical protein
MISTHGQVDEKCGDCQHLVKQGYTAGTYYKCSKAGITRGAATDWRCKWVACGLFTKREAKSHE